MNYEVMKDWCDDTRRNLQRELDRLQEQQRTTGNHLQVLEATDELLAEIDHLKDDLDRKQAEIDDLTQQLEQRDSEIVTLRQQLLEAQNQRLEAEAVQKPAEIHNHFEQGCSAQVFNDKVTSKITKKKKEKRRWKKIVGKAW